MQLRVLDLWVDRRAVGQADVTLAEAELTARAVWGRGQLGLEGRGVGVGAVGVRGVIAIAKGALLKKERTKMSNIPIFPMLLQLGMSTS